ncbi:SpoVT/AbrB domain-containing protein [Desulfovibrio sp. X2]|uniref:AbrB/MazE/SpoVT family DNA-binding domain-containing protein n=1 Tax=Desulfovibrio sp. X2 TaxID=941449 RepID=UPI000358CEF4|nr:AbrB/MazE/SpoVT family DNA-binding domain-containing protein [Desulfovibrio sp. X2]EPR44156.1 SpoVT/AbrB domain-containing protein [Desulfovibrio sp. X2]
MRVKVVGAGLVQLPNDVVAHFGLSAGDEVEVFLDGDRAVLYPVRRGGDEDGNRDGGAILEAESVRKSLERRLREEFD